MCLVCVCVCVCVGGGGSKPGFYFPSADEWREGKGASGSSSSPYCCKMFMRYHSRDTNEVTRVHKYTENVCGSAKAFAPPNVRCIPTAGPQRAQNCFGGKKHSGGIRNNGVDRFLPDVNAGQACCFASECNDQASALPVCVGSVQAVLWCQYWRTTWTGPTGTRQSWMRHVQVVGSGYPSCWTHAGWTRACWCDQNHTTSSRLNVCRV